MNNYPIEIETVRALREIIFTIAETNLNEEECIESNHQFVEKVISTFQKKVYSSNGIYVEFIENQFTLRLTVNVFQSNSIVKNLFELQKKIFNDVYRMTGFKITSINIFVKNIILE